MRCDALYPIHGVAHEGEGVEGEAPEGGHDHWLEAHRHLGAEFYRAFCGNAAPPDRRSFASLFGDPLASA